MLCCLKALCVAAILGQTSPGDGWLGSVPVDVPIVVRGKSLEAVRGDLLAMLKAMSPMLAPTVEASLDEGLASARALVGPEVAKSPFLAMIRLPNPQQPAAPDWAMIVSVGDYPGLLKNLAADGEKPKALAGYDSFSSKVGQPWFASHGEGWAAFGSDEAMIKALGKPASKKNKAASADLKTKLLTGDLGIYIDIAEIQKQYGDLFDQVKPALLAQMEQANPAQGANGGKAVLDGVTQILNSGDGLVLSLDFDASAFSLSGLASVRAGTDSARSLAGSKVGPTDLMAKLPNDLMMFISGLSPNNSVATPAGKPTQKTSPELDKAVADRMKALEGKQVMGMSITPMRAVSLADPADPKAVVKLSLDADKARKALDPEAITIKPNALTYKGFQFDQVVSKIDEKAIEQVKAARPDVPNVGDILSQIMPGGSINAYSGTDGTYFLTSTATEATLKAQVDSIQSGTNTLGSLASFQAIRPRFPDQASLLVLVNAQEVVNMFVGMTDAMKKEKPKPASERPRATALLGFSLVNSPKGYDFRLIVPSDVGPVFEKGFSSMAGGVRD